MTEGTRTPSRTRRSYPNLHNLSLAPLSSKYPLDASAPPSPDDIAVHTPRTSYIAQKSAPSTPGILSLSQSRSNSRTRGSRRAKPIYAYDGYFVNPDQPVRVDGDLPKAKSTSTLHHPAGVSFADQPSPVTADGRHHMRKATAPLPLRMPMIRHHTSDASDEWIHRAGLAIAGETRDSKGQGWLVRRESSTSLVDDDPDHPHPRQLLLSGESIDIDDYPTFSPRMSRTGSRLASRMTSRVPSARQSRRGSRAGSRADFAMTSAGLGSAHPSARHSLEIPEFDADDSRFAQPDFVEADDESSGDEEEVARLARERGFGLGGWMDRLIGWTLFSVDEDGEVSSSDDDEDDSDAMAYQAANMTKEEMRLRREVEAKRRKLEREAIIAASAVGGKDGDAMQGGPVVDAAKPPEEGDGWQDAAWLLSVASKAMF